MILKKVYFALMAVCAILASCSTGDSAAAAAAQMLGGSSQALLFINCKTVSAEELEFEFSQPVTVKSLNFEPALEIASIEDGSIVKVRLEESPGPGVLFTADLLAEDTAQNSINVLVQFRSRNDRMPKLVINEICTEYSNTNAGKKEEFIEFKMESAGNLGAMRVVVMGNTNAAKLTTYEFMPVEVEEGEYVTLHLRTWDDFCKDETGDNLEESKSLNSSPTGRDFWLPGTDKLIHKAATVVYVLDQDDNVLDAVMLSATPDPWWKNAWQAEASEFLFSQKAWKSAEGTIGGPAAAVNSSATSNTRTICRDETAEDTNTAADWYIVANSSATPGKRNSTTRYSK